MLAFMLTGSGFIERPPNDETWNRSRPADDAAIVASNTLCGTDIYPGLVGLPGQKKLEYLLGAGCRADITCGRRLPGLITDRDHPCRNARLSEEIKSSLSRLSLGSREASLIHALL